MGWFSEDKVVGSSGENIKTKLMSLPEAIQRQINGDPRLKIYCNNIGTKADPRFVEQLIFSGYSSTALTNILDNKGGHQACDLDPENNFQEAYKRYANLSPVTTEKLQEGSLHRKEKSALKIPSHLR